MSGVNKRLRKKQAKQTLLNSLKASGLSERQARQAYVDMGYSKMAPSELQSKANSVRIRAKVAQQIYDASLNNLIPIKAKLARAKALGNSIISKIEEIEKGWQRQCAYWLETYDVDLELITERWSLVELKHFDHYMQTFIELYGLDNTNSQFMLNYSSAAEISTGYAANARQDLNKIINEVMNEGNRAKPANDSVKLRFKEKADEIFWSSGEVRQRAAHNRGGHYIGNTPPPIDPNLFNK